MANFDNSESVIIDNAATGLKANGSDSIDLNIAEPEMEPKNEQNPEGESSSIEEFVTVEANPFNPSASIVFALNEPSNVKLEIYSMTGQKVSTLVNNFMSAGTHSVKFDGSHFASGVYFYRFNSKNLNKTGKMLLVK